MTAENRGFSEPKRTIGQAVDHPDRRCTATSRSGERCKRWAIKGGRVCRSHGGAAPQVRAAAERRLEQDRIAGEVSELLDRFDIPDEHPLEGLISVVRSTGRMMRALESLVRSLDLRPDVLVDVVGDGLERGGDTGLRFETTNDPLYGPDHKGDGKPHVLVEMWRTWSEQYARVCKLALDAGVDERRLQMEAAEVDTLYAATMKALMAAEVSSAQQNVFAQALAAELRGESMPPLEVRAR